MDKNTLRLHSAMLALLNTHGEFILPRSPKLKLFTYRQRPHVNFISYSPPSIFHSGFIFFSFLFENSDSTIRAARSSEKSRRTFTSRHVKRRRRVKTALRKERDAFKEPNAKAQQDPTWMLLCSRGRKYSKRRGSPPLRVSRSQHTLRIDLKLNTRTYLNLMDIKLKLMMKSV